MQTTLIGGYKFVALPIASSDELPDLPGIYVYTDGSTLLACRPLYIGKASSFKQRFGSHHKWDAAINRGATHLCLLQVPSKHQDEIEQRLIKLYNPPLNEIYRDGPPLPPPMLPKAHLGNLPAGGMIRTGGAKPGNIASQAARLGVLQPVAKTLLGDSAIRVGGMQGICGTTKTLVVGDALRGAVQPLERRVAMPIFVLPKKN